MKSPGPPGLIELVGVAGSGKSSVASALYDDAYVQPPFISARNPRHLMQLLLAIPELSPLLILGLLRKPRTTWADFKLMVYVTRWRGFFLRRIENHDGPVVFDQGPLYALARLEAKGLGIGSTEAFRRWWGRMLTKWAKEMSLVIWLDATNEDLIRRINERAGSHTIKGAPTREATRFLDHYRTVFANLLRRVEQQGAEVVRVDTSDMERSEVVDSVRRLLGQPDDRGR